LQRDSLFPTAAHNLQYLRQNQAHAIRRYLALQQSETVEWRTALLKF
jgi:hypothetical protein